MKHLVQSFKEHVGERGCHFYDHDDCHFMKWSEVFKFISAFEDQEKDTVFGDKLTETLANYNPDVEFLAVHQNGDTVSVELYSQM